MAVPRAASVNTLPAIAAGGCQDAHPDQPALVWTLPTAFPGGSAAAARIAAINTVGILAGFVNPFMFGAIKNATGNTTVCMHALATGLFLGAGPALAFARRRAGERPLAGTDGCTGGLSEAAMQMAW